MYSTRSPPQALISFPDLAFPDPSASHTREIWERDYTGSSFYCQNNHLGTVFYITLSKSPSVTIIIIITRLRQSPPPPIPTPMLSKPSLLPAIFVSRSFVYGIFVSVSALIVTVPRPPLSVFVTPVPARIIP